MSTSVFDDVDRKLRLLTDPDRIRVLKSYRNSLTPVSRLPYFLLADIFAFLLGSGNAHSPACLYVSHVCRAWRDAALQCPLLWVNILFHPPEWTSIMLDRSRTAPLTVDIKLKFWVLPPDALIKSVRLALSHMHHIRYLCVDLGDGDGDGQYGAVLSLLASGSPDILERVKISCTAYHRSHVQPFFDKAPRLRTLELVGCHTDWQLPFASNLTSLVLKNIPPDSRPSMDDIFSILRRLSNLQNLALFDATQGFPRTVVTLPPLQDPAPINLDHLLRLSITGHLLDCINIVRHLVVPHCQLVALDAKMHRRLPEITWAVTHFAALISTIFSRVDERDVPYVGSICQSPTQGTMIFASPTPLSPEAPNKPTVKAILGWYHLPLEDPIANSSLCRDLLLCLPLENLQHFEARSTSADLTIEGTDWLQVLPRLKRVERLTLMGAFAYGFMNGFHHAHVCNEPLLSGTGLPVLPKLISLSIHNAHFSFPLGPPELFSTVKGGLARRRSFDGIMLGISLENCHITPQQLADLRALRLGTIVCTGEPETFGIGESDTGSSEDEDSGRDGVSD
ncbi:hypothetical protein BC834DRAFT_364219 [Gloeopeniophorella convolvens]|nr:hypothetical protein BC834DRAFT_364219 [Gloeopeniophorella convolvens]